MRKSEFLQLSRGQDALVKSLDEFKKEIREDVEQGVGGVTERIDRWITTLKWAVGLTVPVATAAITLWLSSPGGP